MDIACDFMFERVKYNFGTIDWQKHLYKYLKYHDIVAKCWCKNQLYIYRDHHEKDKISIYDVDLIHDIP